MPALAHTARATRVKAAAVSVARNVAIAIGFGVVYYALNAANPTLAKSLTEPFGFTVRLAQLTRAFVFPFGAAVPVGTFLGSTVFNWQMGDLPFVPMANLGIGLLVALGSKAWGRSTVKDLTLLGVYGITTGLVVALKLTGWALLVAPDTWMPLLTGAVVLKVGVNTLTYLAGYPIMRGFEKVMRRG